MKLKEYLLSTLGSIGCMLYFAIFVMFIALPLVMIDAPFWIDSIIVLFIFFAPKTTSFILWIVGLIYAINGRQDGFAMAYYVIFAIIDIPLFISIIIGFFRKEE